MADANRPDWRVAGLDAAREEAAIVLPFPAGGRDGQRRSDTRWAFTTSVRWVGGAEGDWLRRELARVLRDLLAWAREDMTGDAVHDTGEERAA